MFRINLEGKLKAIVAIAWVAFTLSLSTDGLLLVLTRETVGTVVERVADDCSSIERLSIMQRVVNAGYRSPAWYSVAYRDSQGLSHDVVLPFSPKREVAIGSEAPVRYLSGSPSTAFHSAGWFHRSLWVLAAAIIFTMAGIERAPGRDP